jgi:Transposase DDE domain
MDKDTTKSTLTEYLIPLNVSEMMRDIDSLGLDKYTKKLDTITFAKLFVFAQVKQIGTLTDISAELNESESLQSELNLESISTSQLSRKLRDINSDIFESVFHRCVKQISNRCGAKKATEKLGRIHLIDSSTISMCLSQYPWAEFRRTKAGVKLHLRLMFADGLVYPDKAILTPAKPADKTQMDNLVVDESDALNVFDRGYVDYRKFDQYCSDSIRFVTRLKDNASIHEVVEEKSVSMGSPVIREAVVRLGSRPNHVMDHPVRLIETLDGEGNKVTILTNDFSFGATEICELYRKRWQIELFFKWMKQHLKVKRLYGRSQSAVYTQLRIALIAFCLLVLMQLKLKHRGRLLDVYKCVQRHWAEAFSEFMHYLTRPPTRHSQGRRKLDVERIFADTLQQFTDGDIEHLDCLTYDPLI